MGNADSTQPVTGQAARAATERTRSAEPGTGPVHPTSSAFVAHRPLGRAGVRLTAGLLHEWQVRNREASLQLALRQLEEAGNLENLRLAAVPGSGEAAADGPGPVRRYRGPALA